MSYLTDRLAEKSTWAGISAIVSILPLGIYTGTVQQLIGLARDNAPAVNAAVQAHDWGALIVTAGPMLVALVAILKKER